MRAYSLTHLGDAVLTRELAAAVAHERTATAAVLVFRLVSHVNDPPRHPGPGQGATTKMYPGDTSRRSNAALAREGRRGVNMTYVTEH